MIINKIQCEGFVLNLHQPSPIFTFLAKKGTKNLKIKADFWKISTDF